MHHYTFFFTTKYTTAKFNAKKLLASKFTPSIPPYMPAIPLRATLSFHALLKAVQGCGLIVTHYRLSDDGTRVTTVDHARFICVPLAVIFVLFFVVKTGCGTSAMLAVP